MIPGQLGPTIRDLFWVLSMSVMRTMSTSISLRIPRSVIVVHTVLWDTLSDTVRCKFPGT
jgi:hypothetical protein